MSTVVQAVSTDARGVSDPSFRFDSLYPFYRKSRAIIGGQYAAKAYDCKIDRVKWDNLLIPFSTSMSEDQYAFFRMEAELPGFCSQYMRVLVAGLLRKRPDLILPESVPEGAYDWIMSDFTSDHGSLVGFLDEALEEEITTSRAWVMVNFPYVEENADLTPEQKKNLKPYPILMKAESVINWRDGSNPVTGEKGLQMVIIRQTVEKYLPGEFHPSLIDTVWVHEINGAGNYQIRVYEKTPEDSVDVISGDYVSKVDANKETFDLVATETNILSHGKHLTSIPIFPLNGMVQGEEPILMPLIDREVGLYNKISRRNHLMYGAATYTPVIKSQMTDEELDKICQAGLGSWLRVQPDEDISILDTPTAALKDMDRAIEQTVLEIARMGIRMLAPDVREQSGVALEIKNAAQTAQLATLNVKISQVMRAIITTMINWRYDMDISEEDVIFNLSPDFNPAPLGEEWLRLVTEWYDTGKIPRSTFLQILKSNDIIPSDYNDDDARQEIEQDDLIAGPAEKQKDMEVDKLVEISRRTANDQQNMESGSSNDSVG